MPEEQNADALTTGQQLVLHLLQVLRRHGCPAVSFAETLEWLDQRLTAGEEYARLVATPQRLDEFDGAFEETRSPGRFAAKMRATQEQSAQQAMILMADDLQRALEENARLREYNAQVWQAWTECQQERDELRRSLKWVAQLRETGARLLADAEEAG